MPASDIDKTAICAVCTRFIEHFAGVSGSQYMTPFWRHMTGAFDHPAVPQPGSEKEVER